MNGFYEDDDEIFPAEPGKPIWRIAVIGGLVALIILLIMSQIAGEAKAGEYRNHEWHKVEGKRCFSELFALPVVTTTLRKIGTHGLVKRRVSSRTGQFRIVTYSREGAPYVFELRLRPGLRGCLDAWRTRYLDAPEKEEGI